ncbi:MAG TPA: putative PEP-binding protein [Sulfuricaulis sp.]|nr:putative PEP-binding protein [Sulfuricaulis sp.]
MPAITGMAYVPGTARGVLSRMPRPGAIWLVRQSELRTLSATLAGAVVVDGAPFSHRDEPELARYLDPHAPVLYRFLRTVAQNAGAQLLRVQVCGVLAQLAGGLPLLLGLGYRVFSVDPVVIPWLAATVARLDSTRTAALADAACAARTTDEVHSLLTEDAMTGL